MHRKPEYNYKTEEYGLFLGFMTMPFGKEKEFLEYEIENFFAGYKLGIKKNLQSTPSSRDPFNKYLYKPKSYFLFGNFDLAVFALVDDFSLATRSFHPYSHQIRAGLPVKEDGYTANNYTFHIISGVAPDLKYIDDKEDSLIERAEKTFLSKEVGNYPFIGITSLKLNNSLMIGEGHVFIDLVIRKIRKTILEHESSASGNLAYLIVHSFSWHEMTIVFFGDDYGKMANLILKIRDLTFGDLFGVINNDQLVNRVFENSLISKYLEKEGLDSAERLKRVKQSHLIVNTLTTFGFDVDLLLRSNERLKDPFKDNLQFSIRWSLKPGHLRSFKDYFEREVAAKLGMKDFEGRITVGRGDYVTSFTKDAIHHFSNIRRLMGEPSLREHVRKVSATPELKTGVEPPGRNVDQDIHYPFHSHLSEFCFPIEQIAEVHQSLKRLRVPKILREKIINMYIVFNDGIHDPILYGYFIELKGYLKEVKGLLKEYAQIPDLEIQELVEKLTVIPEQFEIAYKNRFGQSYIMNEITDFNMDFNGGIQQLIAAYDSAYKSFSNFLGPNQMNTTMAYVSGHPIIESDPLTVRLNYFHLFQPEFFAVAAFHEAANHFFARIPMENGEGERSLVQNMVGYLSKLIDDAEAETGALQRGMEVNSFELETIRYFLTDMITFFLAFNVDFPSFFYWHWASLIQTGILYKLDGHLNERIFDHFMVRVLLLDEYLGINYLKGCVVPPLDIWDTKIYKAWGESLKTAQFYVKKIMKDHDLFLNWVRNYTLGLLVRELDFKKKNKSEADQEALIKDFTYGEWAKDILLKYAYNENDIRARLITSDQPLGPRQMLGLTRLVYMDKISADIKKTFEQGCLYNFDSILEKKELHYVSPSFVFQCLFNAYLSLIRTLGGENCHILFRDNDGEAKPSELLTYQVESNVALKFDPSGGVFITSLEARRKYYQYRILFLKSLWFLSVKFKMNLFEMETLNNFN